MPGRGTPSSAVGESSAVASGAGRGTPRAPPSMSVAPPAVLSSTASLQPLQQREHDDSRAERRPPLRLKPFLPHLLDTRPTDFKDKLEAHKGNSGTEVAVKTNFISIMKPLRAGEDFKKLYMVKTYFVEFQPMILARSDKISILQKIFTHHLHLDPKKICFHLHGSFLVLPASGAVDLSGNLKTDDKYVIDNIVVQFYLRRTSDALSGDCLALVDTLFNSLIRKGGYKFLNNIAINLKSNRPIPDVSEAFSVQGFVPTVCPVEAGLYLQIGLQVKVISKDSLAQMLTAKQSRARSAGDFREWVEKQLLKRYVMAKHNDVFYQIDGFNWNADENLTVDLSGSRTVTIRDYFKERYGITLASKEFIVMVKGLQIGNEPKRKQKKDSREKAAKGEKQDDTAMPMPASCLVLCSIHPDIRDDARRMRNVLAAGRKEPHEYYEALGKFAGMFFENTEIRDEMSKWGFEFLSEDDLKPAKARALGVQPLIATGQPLRYDEATADWARNIRSVPITRQAQLVNSDRIRLLFLAGDRDIQLARDFGTVLTNAVKSMGIKFDTYEYVTVMRGSQDINEWAEQISVNLGQKRAQLDMVVTLLPDDAAERYKLIKQETVLSKHAITSQCLKVNTIREPKKQMTVATKLGMQMVAKLGGAVWRSNFQNLDMPQPLFIGILVHKMAKSYDKFATIVSNIDALVTSYTLEIVPTVSLKDPSRTVHDIAKGVKSCVEAFMDKAKATPSHVIIHRLEDNDGLIEQHHLEEGPAIVDTVYGACEGRGPKPNVVYMLASKQTKTRFWQHQRDQHANCAPGTVLDTDIVSPLRHDFYLISSAPRQGISGPTYYNVLINTGGVPMDTLQLATYRLTMLYYNWTGPVSIPATLQYALKAAKLISDHLGHEGALVMAQNSFGLRNQLFYL